MGCLFLCISTVPTYLQRDEQHSNENGIDMHGPCMVGKKSGVIWGQLSRCNLPLKDVVAARYRLL